MLPIEPRNRHERRFYASRKIVLYYRVSTTKQGADGIGIAAQKRICLDFLNGGEWEVIGEYIEVESGAKNDRPQLEEALALCARKNAVLVVAKLDRLSRSPYFINMLLESNIDFIAADAPDMFSSGDKMKVQMLAMLAGYERDMISARVTSAQAVMKSHIEKKGYHETKEGERLTKLGSKDWEAVQAKGYEKVSANAMTHAMRIYPVIERCRQLGITSMRAIATELTDRKIETPSRQAKIDKRKPVFGAPSWHPQQVKAIIDRIENQK